MRGFVISVLGCVSVAAGWAAKPELLPGLDERWRHYESAHFELFSHVGESDSRGLLHDLELLRAVFMDRFHFAERRHLDVSVYAFSSRREFQGYSPDEFGKRKRLGGFYLAGPDRAVIVMAPTEDREDARAVIFHEYVHHLFKAAEEDPPVWYNEGMAELLAGIKVETNEIEIGHPVVGRLLDIHHEKLLSLETLFSVSHQSPLYQSSDHTGLFYAESWALLHYWYFGQSGLDPEKTEAFVRVATGREHVPGPELRAYFQACFGMDYPEMLRRLEQYVHSGRYTFGRQPLPDIPAAATYAESGLSADVMRLRLAELSVRVNSTPGAALVLLQARDQKSRDPRILEALGADAVRHGDRSGAVTNWEAAIAAGSTNVAITRELALLECEDWFTDFDFDAKLPAEAAVRLRARLLRAIELEPRESAACEALAWVEALSDDRSIANVNLVQSRFPGLQHKARTVVALAMVRARTGHKDEALKLLKQVAKLDPDEWTAQAAEVAMARLEDRPVQHAAGTRAGAEVDADTSGEIRNLVRLPSVPVPEDL